MRTVNIVILALVMALATVGLGWWAVPVCAALVAAVAYGRGGRGIVRPGRSAAGGSAFAAALAWGGLLALDAFHGGPRFAALASTLGGVLGVSPLLVELGTLLLPALLAWCAAAVVEGVMARAFPERAGPPHRDDGGGGCRPRVPVPPPVAPHRPLTPEPFAPAPEERELVGAP